MDTKNQEDRWKAVLERDRRFNGSFVYGVRSTRIYLNNAKNLVAINSLGSHLKGLQVL